MQYDEEYYLNFGHKNANISLVHNNIDVINNSQDILIAPAGYGAVSNYCKGLSKNVTSIDISGYLVKKSNGLVRYGDIRDINYTNQFDLIICKDLLEHFNIEDIEKVLIKLYSALKDNGKIIIGVGTDQLDCFHEDPTHITYKSDRWWIDKFLGSGFYLYEFCKVSGEFVLHKKKTQNKTIYSKKYKNTNKEILNIKLKDFKFVSYIKNNIVYFDIEYKLNQHQLNKHYLSVPVGYEFSLNLKDDGSIDISEEENTYLIIRDFFDENNKHKLIGRLYE